MQLMAGRVNIRICRDVSAGLGDGAVMSVQGRLVLIVDSRMESWNTGLRGRRQAGSACQRRTAADSDQGWGARP
jgi:hypothetical protein